MLDDHSERDGTLLWLKIICGNVLIPFAEKCENLLSFNAHTSNENKNERKINHTKWNKLYRSLSRFQLNGIHWQCNIVHSVSKKMLCVRHLIAMHFKRNYTKSYWKLDVQSSKATMNGREFRIIRRKRLQRVPCVDKQYTTNKTYNKRFEIKLYCWRNEIVSFVACRTIPMPSDTKQIEWIGQQTAHFFRLEAPL